MGRGWKRETSCLQQHSGRGVYIQSKRGRGTARAGSRSSATLAAAIVVMPTMMNMTALTGTTNLATLTLRHLLWIGGGSCNR